MVKKHESISDGIRRAISKSDLTAYKIAIAAEIDHSAFSKFRSGKMGLSLDAVDRLGKVLGLRIVVDQPAKTPAKRKGSG